MPTGKSTRRRFLELAGAGVAAASPVGVSSVGSAATENGWSTVESGTGKTLYDAVSTLEEPYAVGSGGDVLARRAEGWEQVLDAGPTTESNTLRGIDVTDDGRNVWFAGSSGAVGKYDTATGEMSDYSAPNSKSSTWESILIGGAAGSETIYLANGSGEVLVGQNSAGKVTWGDALEPGGGSSIKGGDLIDPTTSYFSDTNAKVYESTNDGESYDTIGIEGGSIGLYGVGAADRDDISVAGGDGSVFRYNGAVWTKLAVGGSGLNALERAGTSGLTVGGSGTIYRRTWTGWEEEETPAGNALQGVTFGTSGPDVAVGSSGTILERQV